MKMNIDKISFRRATVDDIRVLVENRIVFLKEIQPFPSQELEYTVRRSLKQYLFSSLKNETFISWIAEYEYVPVGFSGMVIRKQAGNFQMPNGITGYILNMYTLKEYRSMGIGTSLFEKLMEEARKRNLNKIELHASIEGERLYRRFGFTEPVNKALEIVLSCGGTTMNQLESDCHATIN